MNIIKLKDQIKPKDAFFNNSLKGKYAYCIRWTYVVPIEDITVGQYVQMEKTGVIDCMYREYDKISSYIDVEETTNVNDINKYIVLNKYVTDPEITIDELKKFRTWLAEYLLTFDQDIYGDPKNEIYTEAQTHVLQYYANGMYDDVVKNLGIFGQTTLSLTATSTSCGCGSGTVLSAFGGKQVISANPTAVKMSTCGCGDGQASLSSLALNGISNCDPLLIYRKNIYFNMVSMFSNIDFWKQFSSNFLKDFKKYIDGIINYNLPLANSEYISSFADCGCLSEKDASQKVNIQILRNLSSALQFMADREFDGHKNAISAALSSWSSTLYEKMYWA